MSIDNIISIIISILSSSVITLILTTLVFQPMQEKRKYIFDEKKRVYESIIIFAQIIVFPDKARYALGVARYDITQLTDEENVKNALNDLKMAIPKVRLISNDMSLILEIETFIQTPSEAELNILVDRLRKDLYK